MQKQPFPVEGGSKKLEDWGVTFAGGGGVSTPLHAMSKKFGVHAHF